MPLLKFDLIEGRTNEQVRLLLDSAHEAMVQAFEVPSSDRYQIVSQHHQAEMVIEDTGLGYPRSRDVVFLTVISRPRSEQQKTNFFRLLADKLNVDCGLSRSDLVVSIVENSDADWSFGDGQAQFLTGDL